MQTRPSCGAKYKMSDDIPDQIGSYLAQIPSSAERVDINNRGALTQLEQFRALGFVVLAEGWSGLESWGVWSAGDNAIFYAKHDTGRTEPSSSDEVVIHARGAVSENHPCLAIRFKLGSSWTDFNIFLARNLLRTDQATNSCRTPKRTRASDRSEH